MKWKKNKILPAVALLIILMVPFCTEAQKNAEKKTVSFGISYWMNNNRAVYIIANAKSKVDGKFQPDAGVKVSIYLDKDSSANLIGKYITDAHGLAKAIIPPSLQSVWNASPKHTFLAKTEEDKFYESADAEISISKSKILLDTVSDGEKKSVTVSVSAFNGTTWMPVSGVEMKVGVSRSVGSILAVSDKDAYTTDSTGKATIEITKAKFPGDEKGNIVLVARVDENEQLGNLIIEKTVPWGTAVTPDNSFFDQRALWATRFRTPIWLLVMAYSIVIGVWGTIIYLIMLLLKIKKLGMAEA